ncbi:MAG: MFS transporter [Deltaproteobacteria bacterium]|nr:MFS transporter [Deltaproteobacteria bacterium]
MLHFQAFEALRHREFRLLWFGQACTGMGVWMDQVTRGWLIYELTDSSLQLGLVRGIQAIPFLLLSPVAGSAADRYPRKIQLLVAQLVDGLLYSAIALLIFTGRIQPWHVYVSAVLMAMVQVFQQPARAAMVADAVPPRNLTNAIGLNAVIFNVARSTGPALAGMLIAVFGTGGSYSAQAIFYFLATIWTLRLRSAKRIATDGHGHLAHAESFGQSIIEGWKFSWNNEVVRVSLLVVMLASLLIVPFTTLLPVFARDILGVGAPGQGLLLTAMGIGALGSAILIACVGDALPRGMLMLGGVMVYGFVVVIFAGSPWFQLSMALMVIVGLCHVHSHALVQTVIQAYSPAEFRGRTMAIFHLSQVVLTVGSMLIGALSSVFGAQWAVAWMGGAGALAMIAMYLALPNARLIR